VRNSSMIFLLKLSLSAMANSQACRFRPQNEGLPERARKRSIE
jgi:hypothetical protein